VIKKKSKIRQRRTSKLEKRKNVSKKMKENKIVQGRKVSKKVTRQIKKTKKRNIRKSRRVNRKHGFFVFFLDGFQDWLKGGMKKIRKKQRHCLRFKKYKGRQTFCFVKALLFEYPWRTMLGFVMVSIIGLSVLTINIPEGSMSNYFGINLRNDLIAEIDARINSFKNKIFNIQKCTKDKYWLDNEDKICNYWLYQQNNQHCAKFNINTKRVTIGTKMCCNSLESIIYDGEGKNVIACPGADIFFDRNAMHDATLVADKSGCRASVCQFYPDDGYLIKFDTEGNIVYGKQGQPIVIKPCPVKRKVGPCNKECGGGQRTVTGQDMYCNEFTMTELCNVEPCFAETIVN
jgi:hypothetical protein